MSVKIDIILPNYNKEMYLNETIDSIINQTYENWRLLLIDDCSTDNSNKVIKKYESNKKINIIYLRKNMGAAFTRNLGLRLSTSDYIAFMDADDKWASNKLKDQIDFMQKNNLFFTYTDYTPFYTKNNENVFKKRIDCPDSFNYDQFINNSSIGTSTMILSRNIIGVLKFPKVIALEDFPFKCKLLKKNKMAIKFNQNTTFYRITKNSLGSSKLRNICCLWYINSKFNNLNFFKNFKSLINISINSIKKYGFK